MTWFFRTHRAVLVHAEAIEESEPGLLVGESVEDARRRQIHMEVLMGSTSISDWWFGTMEFYDFPLNVIIPTDKLHFSEGLKPPSMSINVKHNWILNGNRDTICGVLVIFQREKNRTTWRMFPAM